MGVAFVWGAPLDPARPQARGALYVPVTLSGLPGTFLMQLDLGTSQSVLYGVPYRQALRQEVGAPPSTGEGQHTVRLGSVSLGAHRLPILEEFGSPQEPRDTRTVIGTLGLDLLRRHLLILDYPGGRFTVAAPGTALPGHLRGAQFTPMRVEHDKLYVPVRIGDRTYPDFFFDTGSSAFALVTTEAVWRATTGRPVTDRRNEQLQVSAWNQAVHIVGAPAAQEVRIAGVSIGRPLAYTTLAPASRRLEAAPFPAQGLFGNLPFQDRFTVIVDLPGRRFGLLAR